MSDNTIVFYEPVRPGDRLRTRQILRSVSEEKTTRLGTGRFWVIDVEYHNQRGEPVATESYTGFGYRRLAECRGGRRRARRPHVTPRRHRRLHRRRGRGRRAPAAALPGHGHHGRARRPGRPRLAAHAPRPGLRRPPQRHPRHLPQHPEPGPLVRAVRDRLERALRPPRPDDLPHARLDLPRRHHGLRGPGHRRCRPTTSGAAGPSSTSPSPSTASARRPAGPGSPCRPTTTTTHGNGRATGGARDGTRGTPIAAA